MFQYKKEFPYWSFTPFKILTCLALKLYSWDKRRVFSTRQNLSWIPWHGGVLEQLCCPVERCKAFLDIISLWSHGKAFEIPRVREVWSELAYSYNRDISDECVVTTWNPYKSPDIQGWATSTYVCAPDCYAETQGRRQILQTKTPTSFSLKYDLFISRNVRQLKSCQPDPNPSYSPNPWSSLQKPFPPRAMISSDLISEMGPGLAGTLGDTSQGTPGASQSSWWRLSQVLGLTPNPCPNSGANAIGLLKALYFK